jgi:hypothetical protein
VPERAKQTPLGARHEIACCPNRRQADVARENRVRRGQIADRFCDLLRMDEISARSGVGQPIEASFSCCGLAQVRTVPTVDGGSSAATWRTYHCHVYGAAPRLLSAVPRATPPRALRVELPVGKSARAPAGRRSQHA